MVKQERMKKRYVITEASVTLVLRPYFQSLAKKKHPQRKRRMKSRSSSFDRSLFPSASISLDHVHSLVLIF